MAKTILFVTVRPFICRKPRQRSCALDGLFGARGGRMSPSIYRERKD